MIRENKKIINTARVLLDILIFMLSITAAYFFRFSFYNGPHIPLDFYLKISMVAVPVYLLIFHNYQMYESAREKRLTLEAGRIMKANLLGVLFIFIVSFMIKEIDVSRMVILLFGTINTFLMVLSRYILRKIIRAAREKGYASKKILIVGYNELAMTFVEKIITGRNPEFEIIGFLSDKFDGYDSFNIMNLIPCKGRFAELEKVLAAESVDEVVIALGYDQFDLLAGTVGACEKAGTRVSIIPFYTKYLPARLYVDEIDGLPVINIRRVPLDNLMNYWLKRVFDFFASLILVIILMPLLLIIAASVKATSPGPVFYKQKRVGFNKRDFTMYKFRSMRVVKDGSDQTAWTTKNDPRKTKFGAFMRKYNIDELPQLINVLNGTMSLVGPRPELPFHVNNFKEEIPLYMVKHQVRPGITGWAQVNGLRGDTSIKARIEHDIYYIENWSFLFDIKILIMTVLKGMVSRSE